MPVESYVRTHTKHGITCAGYVVLNNLELKPEAIDLLQLPVSLVRGYIGRIEFQIPWGNPGTKPTVVKVDQVYIAVETKYRWSGSQAQRRRKVALKSKLERVEAQESKLVKRNRGDSDDAAAAPTEAAGLSGFVERLLTKIADNLQVHIRGVHLRWEDRVTTPTRPFAAGITLESLHLQTTDGAFRPSMVEATSGTLRTPLVFKALHINCLSVYWNPHMYLCDADGPIIVPTSDVATVLPELTVEQPEDPHELPQHLLHMATPAVTDDGRPAGAVRSVTPIELLRARDATLSSRRAAAAHSNLYPLYNFDSGRETRQGRFLLPFAGSDVSSMVGGASSVASTADAQDAHSAHRFTQAAHQNLERWAQGASKPAKNGSRTASQAAGDERYSPAGASTSPNSMSRAAGQESPKLSPFFNQTRRKSSPAQSSVGSTEDELYGGMLDLRTCHLETLVSLFEGMVAKRAQSEHTGLETPRIIDSRQMAGAGYMSGLFSSVSWLLGGQRDAVATEGSFVSSLPTAAPASARRNPAMTSSMYAALGTTDGNVVPSSADCPRQCFLLSPISAELRMQLSKNPRDLRHPQQAFSLRLPAVHVRLGRDQLQSILQASSSISNALLAAQLDSVRPTRALKSRGPVAWMQAPQAAEHRGVIRSWFRFAARQLLQRLRRRSGHISWMQLRRLRLLRQVYVQLYKRNLVGRQSPPKALDLAPISTAFSVWLSTVAVSAERVESTLPTPTSMGSLGGTHSARLPQSNSMASLHGLGRAWDGQKHRSAVLRCWPDPAEVLSEWHSPQAQHSRSISASSTPFQGPSAKSPLASGPSSAGGFRPTDLSPIASVAQNSSPGATAHRSISASRSPFPDLGSDESDGSGVHSPSGMGASGVPWRASSAGRSRLQEDDSMASPGLNSSLLSMHMPQSRPFLSQQLSVGTEHPHEFAPDRAAGIVSPSASRAGAFSPFSSSAPASAGQHLQFSEAEAWVAACTFIGVGAPVESYDSVEGVQSGSDILAASMSIAGRSCGVLQLIGNDSCESGHAAGFEAARHQRSAWSQWAKAFKSATTRLQSARSSASEHNPHADLDACQEEVVQLLRQDVTQKHSNNRYTRLHELEKALLHRMEECVDEDQLLAWRRTARQQLLREEAARKVRRAPRHPTSARASSVGAREQPIVSPVSGLASGAASSNSGEPPRKGSGVTEGTFPNMAEPASEVFDSASVRSGSIRDQVASTWEWAFGGGKPTSAGAAAESVFSAGRQDEVDEKLQMKQDMLTEAQRRELFAVIDYDPSMLALKYPKGYVQQEVQLNVESCSVNLLTCAHADSRRTIPVFAFQHMKNTNKSELQAARSFFALKLASAGCLLSVRPDSFKLQTELLSMAAWDLSGISNERYSAICLPTADKELIEKSRGSMAHETPGAGGRSVPASPRLGAARPPDPPSPTFAAVGKTALATVQEVPEPCKPVFELTFETFGLHSKSPRQQVAGSIRQEDSTSSSGTSSRETSSDSNSTTGTYFQQDSQEAGAAEEQEDRGSVTSAASSFSGVSGSAGRGESFGIVWGSGIKSRHIRVEGTTRRGAEAPRQGGNSATLAALGWADDRLHSIEKPEWALRAHAALSCRLEPLEMLVSGHVTSFLQEFCDVPLAGVSDEFELEAAARLAMWRQRTAAKLAFASAQRQITAIDAVIASPVLRMVADASAQQACELQFSAGVMHLKSRKLRQGAELLQAGAKLESATKCSSDYTALPSVPLAELCDLFDHFELSMSGLKLSLCNNADKTSSGAPAKVPPLRQRLETIQLIEPVDIRWSLYLCVIEADVSLPQARLHAALSGLNLSLHQADLPHLLAWFQGIKETQNVIGPATQAAAIAREVERQNFASGVGHRYAVLSAGVSEADFIEEGDSESDAPVFDDNIHDVGRQPSTVFRSTGGARRASIDGSMVRGAASIISRVLETQSVFSTNHRTAVTRNDTFVTAHSGSLLSDGQRGAFGQASVDRAAPVLGSIILPFLYSTVPLAQAAIDVDFVRIRFHDSQYGALHLPQGSNSTVAQGSLLLEVSRIRGAVNVSATEARLGFGAESLNCQLMSPSVTHPFLWQLNERAAHGVSEAPSEDQATASGEASTTGETELRWLELCRLFSLCISSGMQRQFLQVNVVTVSSPAQMSVEVQAEQIGFWSSPRLLGMLKQWGEQIVQAGPVEIVGEAKTTPQQQQQDVLTVECSFRGRGACAVLQLSESTALLGAVGPIALKSVDTANEDGLVQHHRIIEAEWIKCLLCKTFDGVAGSKEALRAAYFDQQGATSLPFASIATSVGGQQKSCLHVEVIQTEKLAQDSELASNTRDVLFSAYSAWLCPSDAQRLAAKGGSFFKMVDTDITHVNCTLGETAVDIPLDEMVHLTRRMQDISKLTGNFKPREASSEALQWPVSWNMSSSGLKLRGAKSFSSDEVLSATLNLGSFTSVCKHSLSATARISELEPPRLMCTANHINCFDGIEMAVSSRGEAIPCVDQFAISTELHQPAIFIPAHGSVIEALSESLEHHPMNTNSSMTIQADHLIANCAPCSIAVLNTLASAVQGLSSELASNSADAALDGYQYAALPQIHASVDILRVNLHPGGALPTLASLVLRGIVLSAESNCNPTENCFTLNFQIANALATDELSGEPFMTTTEFADSVFVSARLVKVGPWSTSDDAALDELGLAHAAQGDVKGLRTNFNAHDGSDLLACSLRLSPSTLSISPRLVESFSDFAGSLASSMAHDEANMQSDSDNEMELQPLVLLLHVESGLQSIAFKTTAGTAKASFQVATTCLASQGGEIVAVCTRFAKLGASMNQVHGNHRQVLLDTSALLRGVLRKAPHSSTGAASEIMQLHGDGAAADSTVENLHLLSRAGQWVQRMLSSSPGPKPSDTHCESAVDRLWWLPSMLARAAEEFLHAQATNQFELAARAAEGADISWFAAEFGNIQVQLSRQDVEWASAFQQEFELPASTGNPPAGGKHEQVWQTALLTWLSDGIPPAAVSCSCPIISLEWLLEPPVEGVVQVNGIVSVKNCKLLGGSNPLTLAAGIQAQGVIGLAVLTDLQTRSMCLYEAAVDVLLTGRSLHSKLHMNADVSFPALSGSVNLDTLDEFCAGLADRNLEPPPGAGTALTCTILVENQTGAQIQLEANAANQPVSMVSASQAHVVDPGGFVQLDGATKSLRFALTVPSSFRSKLGESSGRHLEEQQFSQPQAARRAPRLSPVTTVCGPQGYGDSALVIEQRSRLPDGRLMVRLLSPAQLHNRLPIPVSLMVMGRDGHLCWSTQLNSGSSSYIPADLAAALCSSDFDEPLSLRLAIAVSSEHAVVCPIPSQYFKTSHVGRWGVMDGHRQLTTVGISDCGPSSFPGLLFSRSIPTHLAGRKFILGSLSPSPVTAETLSNTTLPVEYTEAAEAASGSQYFEQSFTAVRFEGGVITVGDLLWPQTGLSNQDSISLALSSPLVIANISQANLQVQVSVCSGRDISAIADASLPSMMQADVLPKNSWRNALLVSVSMSGVEGAYRFVVGHSEMYQLEGVACTGNLVGEGLAAGVQLFASLEQGACDPSRLFGIHCCRSSMGGVVCTISSPTEWDSEVPTPKLSRRSVAATHSGSGFSFESKESLVLASFQRTHELKNKQLAKHDQLAFAPDCSAPQASGNDWLAMGLPSGDFLPVQTTLVGSKDLFSLTVQDWAGKNQAVRNGIERLLRTAQVELRSELLGNHTKTWQECIQLRVGQGATVPCTVSVGVPSRLQKSSGTLTWLHRISAEVPLSVSITPARSIVNELDAPVQIAQEGTHPRNWVQVNPGQSWVVSVLDDSAALPDVNPFQSCREGVVWGATYTRGGVLSLFDTAVFAELQEQAELGILLDATHVGTQSGALLQPGAPESECAPVQPLFRLRVLHDAGPTSWSGSFPASAAGKVLACHHRMGMISPWLKLRGGIVQAASKRTIDSNSIAGPSTFVRLKGGCGHEEQRLCLTNPTQSDAEIIEICNSSSLTLIINQKGISQEEDRHELLPGQGMLYSWAQPCVVAPSSGGRTWTKQHLKHDCNTYWGSSQQFELEVKAVVQLPATFMQSAMTSRVLHTVEAPLANIHRGEIKDCTVAIGGVSQQILRIVAEPSVSGRFSVAVRDARRLDSEADGSEIQEIQWTQQTAPDTSPLVDTAIFSSCVWGMQLKIGSLQANVKYKELEARLLTQQVVARASSAVHRSDTVQSSHAGKACFDEVGVSIESVQLDIAQNSQQLLQTRLASDALRLEVSLDMSQQRDRAFKFASALLHLGNADIQVDVLAVAQQARSVALSTASAVGAMRNRLSIVSETAARANRAGALGLQKPDKLDQLAQLDSWKVVWLGACVPPSCWQIATDLMLLMQLQPTERQSESNSLSLTLDCIELRPFCMNLSAQHILEPVAGLAVPGILPSIRNLHLCTQPFVGRRLYITAGSAEAELSSFVKHISPGFVDLALAATSLSFRLLPSIPAPSSLLRVVSETPLVLLPLRAFAAAVSVAVYTPARGASVACGLLQLSAFAATPGASNSTQLQATSFQGQMSSLLFSSGSSALQALFVPLSAVRSLLTAVETASLVAFIKSTSSQ